MQKKATRQNTHAAAVQEQSAAETQNAQLSANLLRQASAASSPDQALDILLDSSEGAGAHGSTHVITEDTCNLVLTACLDRYAMSMYKPIQEHCMLMVYAHQA